MGAALVVETHHCGGILAEEVLRAAARGQVVVTAAVLGDLENREKSPVRSQFKILIFYSLTSVLHIYYRQNWHTYTYARACKAYALTLLL